MKYSFILLLLFTFSCSSETLPYTGENISIKTDAKNNKEVEELKKELKSLTSKLNNENQLSKKTIDSLNKSINSLKSEIELLKTSKNEFNNDNKENEKKVSE